MTSMTSVRLKNLELFCAKAGRLGKGSITIIDGVIRPTDSKNAPTDLPEIDCSGMIATQGFVDLLAEGGEPGDEHREDFKSLAQAALIGGFTTVCVSPDTQPVNDARSVTEWIHRRAELDAEVEICPIAAATRSLDGEALSDIFDLKEAGVAGVQLGRGSIANSGLMRRAYEYAKGIGLTVFERPLDLSLHRGGLMHEGRWSTKAGVKGSPSAAEDVAVSRAVALADLVQSPIHIGPLSSARSVEMVRRAKGDGLPVTASVNVLNLYFTSQAVADTFHPSLNVVPPLRNELDRAALIAGVKDGTIDAISSGHSAQTTADKQRPFEWSTPGACTLPIALSVLMALVERSELKMDDVLGGLVSGGRRVLGRQLVPLMAGGQTLTVFDPNEQWDPSTEPLGSKGRNVPNFESPLLGRVRATLVNGNLFFRGKDMTP